MDKNLIKLLPFVSKYKSDVILNVIYNILYAFFGTLGMVTLIPTLNVIFEKTEPVHTLVSFEKSEGLIAYLENFLGFYVTKFTEDNGKEYALFFVIGIVITTFLLKNLFNFLASRHITNLRNYVLRDLRETLFNKIIHLPLSYFSDQRKGDIMAKMLGDVGEVQNSFFQILELLVREPITIVFSIITMYLISPQLTLFVFIFIPISGIIISRIGKTLKAKSVKAQQEQGFFISILDESLSGMKVVKGYNAEGNFFDRFTGSLNKLLKLNISISNKNNLASPTSEFLGIITIAVLMWYGGKLVLIDKTLNPTSFLGYITLAYNILTPAKGISKASFQVKSGLAAAERVFTILELENNITNKPNPFVKNTFEEKISIKNINFSYEDQVVLHNFSIEVPKGKTIALVGQSGSGKSTIANLLTRFYDVQQGGIEVDGVDVKDWDMHALRGLMGLVTQDSILFNDTIKNNLLIGKPNATDDEIIEALKTANAYEFVKDLPNGFNTSIGDAGGKLSGGQKQRLSIARAVLKNPPIMILDEATSALDTESEKLVQDALENMMQNRTSIVIAHRLSTIQKADNIVVMQKGRIVEQGTHNQLIALKGTYAKLVDLQSFEGS